MATSSTTTEPTPEPTPTPTPAPEPKPPEPGLEQEARGATEFKEDVVTVTPVPTLVKEEQTVGGRYYEYSAARMAQRDAGMNYAGGQCGNCGHIEAKPPTDVPRTQYMACPVCGDTIRFTGVGIRDPNAAPLPALSDEDMRARA